MSEDTQNDAQNVAPAPPEQPAQEQPAQPVVEQPPPANPAPPPVEPAPIPQPEAHQAPPANPPPVEEQKQAPPAEAVPAPVVQQPVAAPPPPVVPTQPKMSPDIIRTLRKRALDDYKTFNDRIGDYLKGQERMMESIQARVVQIAEGTEISLNTLSKFFEEKLKFFKEYSKNVTPKLPRLGGNYKLVSQTGQNFEEIGQALTEIDDIEGKTSQHYTAIAQYIEKNILNETIYPSLNQYKAKFAAFKTSISQLKEAKTSVENDARKNGQKFLKACSEDQLNVPKGQERVDAYNLMLMAVAALQSAHQKLQGMAKELLKFWDAVSQLESSRLEITGKCLKTYFERAIEWIPRHLVVDGVAGGKSLEKFNPKEIVETLLSPKGVLPPEDHEYLLKVLQKSELQLADLHYFFVEYPVEFPKETLLVKKFMLSAKPADFKKQPPEVPKEVSLIFTIDEFLLVFQTSNPFSVLKPAEQMFDLQKTKFTTQSDGVTVDLVETSNVLFITTTKKLSLRFRSKEEVEVVLAMKQ